MRFIQLFNSRNKEWLMIRRHCIQQRNQYSFISTCPKSNDKEKSIGCNNYINSNRRNDNKSQLYDNLCQHKPNFESINKRYLSSYTKENELKQEFDEDIEIQISNLKERMETFFMNDNPSILKGKYFIERWYSLHIENYPDTVKHAKKVFEHLTLNQKSLLETNNDSYENQITLSSLLNRILTMLADNGNIQSTIQYFHQNTTYANTSSYHIMLNLCASHRLAQEAKDILLTMTEHASKIQSKHSQPLQNIENIHVMPDTKSFNLLLKAQRVPQEAQDILERMISLWKIDGHSNIKPDIISFHTVMNAYAQMNLERNQNIKRAEKVKILLDKIDTEMDGTDVKPDITSYNILLHAHTMDKDNHMAEQVLHDLIENSNIQPDTITFATCIKAHIDKKQIKEAERMFQNSDLHQNGDLLSTFAYNTIIRALCDKQHLEQAQQIFNQMKTEPDIDTYNILIDAFCIQNKPTNAHRILDQLEKSSLIEINHLRPTSFSYNSIISAYSNTGQPERAISILRRMEKQYHDGNPNVYPDTISFNVVLSSYLKTKRSLDSGIKAERFLTNLEKQSNNHDDAVKPDIISYTTVMKCWIQSKHKDTLHKINSLLSKLETMDDQKKIKLDANVYNVYLSAFADQRLLTSQSDEDIIQSILDILHRMQSKAKTNDNPAVKPCVITYNTILGIFVKLGRVQLAFDMLHQIQIKNTVSYNTVLQGFANTGLTKEAKDLLEEMDQLSSSTKEARVSPNLHSYNTVISAFAKSKDPINAEKILQLMKQFQKKNQNLSYNSTLLKPDKITYATVMNAYAKSDNPISFSRVKELYNEMEHDFGIKPDIACFNIVIHALARSQEECKAEKVVNLIRHREQRLKPDLTTLNTLLNACAFTTRENEKEKALEIVLTILNHICNKRGNNTHLDHIIENNTTKSDTDFAFVSKLRPDDITFGTLAKACHKLMNGSSESDKLNILESIFRKACEHGQVGKFLWKELNIIMHDDKLSSFSFIDENLKDGKKGKAQNFKNQSRRRPFLQRNYPRSWSRNTTLF